MRMITRSDFGEETPWLTFVDALEAGHALPKATVEDSFLGPAAQTFLSRAAYIPGLGFGVKSVTVVADNATRGLPSIQGAMLVFDDETGSLKATIDSKLVTDIKTAADSALGARYLARADSRTMLVIGAGAVARNIIDAYRAVLPQLNRFVIWNRTTSRAQALADDLTAHGLDASASTGLARDVAASDIVTTATMAIEPILKGAWLRPGTHVDLIGAYRADMREADDAVLTRGQIYVDSRDTTIGHIGELKIPLAAKTIVETDIRADFYDLKAQGGITREADTITVFKNGGGAHLDLMIANAILNHVTDAP